MLGYEQGELEGRDSSELQWRDARPGQGDPAHAEGTRVVRGQRKDGEIVWTELTVSGFDDPDLGWCWVSVHRDISAHKEAEEFARTEGARLADALRGLPLLAYSADRDLRCTLLLDNLVDPVRDDTPRAGPAPELFGPFLADDITSLNRRVLVTGMSAYTEASLGDRWKVSLWVDPLLGDDGEIIGIVGRALGRDDDHAAPEVRDGDGAHAQRTRGPRVFSRLR
jgi:PAS domain-containing protein